MNILPTILPAKRRVHRKRRIVQAGSTPPPVTGARILSVALVGDMQVLVTLTEPVVGIDETSQAIRLHLPGLYWIGSSGWGTEGNTVLFNFDESVASATDWVVPLPSVWLFEDEQQLAPPYSGVVTGE